MDSIILIGPIGVGKTTQAKLLSEKLAMPRCCYDEVKGKYWKQFGLETDTARYIEKQYGTYAMISYMNEFKYKTVCAIIRDFPGHVIDFGGGAQTFDEPHQIARVCEAFKPIKNIFLLLPSDDLETNIRTLPGIKEDYPINAYLILHPSNSLLAKYTIYTLNKSREQICEEILRLADIQSN